MSRLPYYLDGARWGYRLGNQELVDGMYRDGFFCPMAKMVMGETAEVLAEQYKITRDEQDEFALTSQTRAATAIAAGRFKEELVPVPLESKKGLTVFTRDEHPFADASLEKLAKLVSGILPRRNDYRRKFLRHHRRSGGRGSGRRSLREAAQS